MESHFTNIIHTQGFLMLFGKAKGIIIFPDSLDQKNVIRNVLNCSDWRENVDWIGRK